MSDKEPDMRREFLEAFEDYINQEVHYHRLAIDIALSMLATVHDLWRRNNDQSRGVASPSKH